MRAQHRNVRTCSRTESIRLDLRSAKRSFTTTRLSQYMFAVGSNVSDAIVQTWFSHRGITSPGVFEQLRMFFLRPVRSWLVATWSDSRCQRYQKNDVPGLVKIRIGMSWCNAGRGTLARADWWQLEANRTPDPVSASHVGGMPFLPGLETIVG